MSMARKMKRAAQASLKNKLLNAPAGLPDRSLIASHRSTLHDKELINQTLASGRVPICQVEIDNTASRGLQEKLGLVHGGRTVYWYF